VEPGNNKGWLQNQHGGKGSRGKQDRCGGKVEIGIQR